MTTAHILENLEFNENKVAISVLFETETTKEIRILFKKGQLMKKHQTAFPITVQIVKGLLDFGVNNQVLALTEGDIIALEGDVPHDLTAKTDCIVRLTLSKQDTVNRVKKVVE